MERPRRAGLRRVVVAGTTAMLLATAGMLIPDVVAAKPEHTRVRDWVVANKDSLPSTLSEMGAIPQTYRAAVIRHLRAETKSRLAQEQMAELLKRDDLSADQRAFVEALVPTLTPAAYEKPKGKGETAQCERIKQLFPKSEHAAYFSQLGNQPSYRPSLQTATLMFVYASSRLRDLVTVAAHPECTCIEDGSSCTQCNGNTCACADCDGLVGCGCLSMFICDAVCGSWPPIVEG